MMEQWNNRVLFRLLWPLLIEQILGVTIGLADMMMVAIVGEHAVSGVSLVEAINILLIIAFGALATGGSVVVSQYLGRKDIKSASHGAKQLIYVSTVTALIIMGITLLLYRPILQIIYGNIAPDVMAAAETYFWITALSYPFLALYNAAASLFRSMGNSRIPMLVALLVNILNIGGNGVLIFCLHLGVMGAALSTLISRIGAAAVLTALLMSPRSGSITLKGLCKITLEPSMIRRILNVGIPSGLENSMFQLGKILVSRIFTTFGTAAIAANAIAGVINSFAFMPGTAFALAILTVVSQCLGAQDYEAARYFTAKLIKMTYLVMLGANLLILLFMNRIIAFFNLSPEAQDFSRAFLWVHCIASPLTWPLSFALPNALRAAGDARYCMIVAAISMWTIRVSASYFLAYPLGFGPISVWYAMAGDFCLRSTCYVLRWLHGHWQTKRVI
jgi:putative MATE family efflux protein